MTTIGTSYFVNFTKACDYYKSQGCDDLRQPPGEMTPAALECEVRAKIADGEISLGQPALKPGDRLLLIDDGTRYAIEENRP